MTFSVVGTGQTYNAWTNIRASSSHQKFIWTNVQKWVVFEFHWKITFNNKCLSYVILCNTYNWHNRFTLNVPNFINVEFLLFLKSQFTINAQNIPHLNPHTYGHIWSRTVSPFHRSWCTYNGLTGIKDMLV